MLNDKEFIEESLDSSLLFLRTLREYCANIQLAFYKNNLSYSEQAAALALRCEELGRLLVSYTGGVVSPSALKYQIYVTDYTLPLEELTEKLFDIKIATDITKTELEFKPGGPVDPSQELIDNVMKANLEAIQIAQDFILLASSIESQQVKNELFSYTYPALYQYMIRVASIYIEELETINAFLKADPILALNNEFDLNSAMYSIILFLRGLINQSEENYITRLDILLNSYAALLRDYQRISLTPDNQKVLTERSLGLILELRALTENMIQNLLNAKINFIIEPIALDNFYTDMNYFNYLLEKSKQVQDNFS